MRILGIDPGLQVCGYAVVENQNGTDRLIEAGTFRTDANAAIEYRLMQISADMQSIIERLRPDVVAVEQLYSHYAHPRTAILMGHARGVILYAAANYKIKVKSFAATRVKKCITGNGRAGKLQMQRAIQSILGLAKLPHPADVADAIAVAICCANSR